MSYLIGEKLGRRRMLMLAGAVLIIGTVILAASTIVAQLIAGRIITGVVSMGRRQEGLALRPKLTG